MDGKPKMIVAQEEKKRPSTRENMAWSPCKLVGCKRRAEQKPIKRGSEKESANMCSNLESLPSKYVDLNGKLMLTTHNGSIVAQEGTWLLFSPEIQRNGLGAYGQESMLVVLKTQMGHIDQASDDKRKDAQTMVFSSTKPTTLGDGEMLSIHMKDNNIVEATLSTNKAHVVELGQQLMVFSILWELQCPPTLVMGRRAYLFRYLTKILKTPQVEQRTSNLAWTFEMNIGNL
jgi:hypothetical protein